MNCHFCLTAQLALRGIFRRERLPAKLSLFLPGSAVEIGRDRINLVFMGMGEPFLNYDEFMAAVRLLVEKRVSLSRG